MNPASDKPAVVQEPLSGKTVTLQPKDGEVIKVPTEVVPMIQTIKNLLDDMGGAVDESVAVPIQISHLQLTKVVEWCVHHRGETFPEDDRYIPIAQWDKDFTNVSKTILIDILLAANYLDVKPLLNLICKTIAHSVYGKTVDEIREMYKIES